MKQRRVMMADIAAKLGVSRVAVSMALRDHHRISSERRREIKRVAREMGFVPDPFLSALAAHRQQRVTAKEHGVLAWINHWKDEKRLRQFQEFDLYYRGASEAAVKFGYRMDEVRWGLDCSAKRLEKLLLARGIEGILLPPHRELLAWEDFDWSKFSVVRFGLSVPRPDSNVVTSDMYRATVMARNDSLNSLTCVGSAVAATGEFRNMNWSCAKTTNARPLRRKSQINFLGRLKRQWVIDESTA